MKAVRPCVLAGSWYPENPRRLRDQVASFLAGAAPGRLPPGAPVIGLVPHAGYQYSGAVAGHFYGALAGHEFAAVFILAPCHRAAPPRPALSSQQAFATPLGEVPLALDIVSRLAQTGAFAFDDRAHAGEHAVEIQLPFLQCALPAGTPIVPILYPRLDAFRRRAAARALDPWRDGRHLFLVSSDLTHYGADYGYVPFTTEIDERLTELDNGAIKKFLARDAAGLLAYAETTGITMCGLEAAAAALEGAMPGTAQAALLAYARSGAMTGDLDLSVSYAAAVICSEKMGRVAADLDLSPAERAFLVDLARAAVAAAVRGEPRDDAAALAASAGVPLAGALREKRGAFVTLTLDGALRGCIGTLETRKPLIEAVSDSAASAALADPRFAPVTAAELARLQIEVSALTPLRPVAGPQDIVIGRHGILLGKGSRQAVFLPQVPVEQGWDLDTTLSHLALKAGLSADGWRRDCAFQVFEAVICRA